MSAKVICSQGALLLGSLLFFLPFAVISCRGVKVAELTGMQLALGTHIDLPDGIGVPSLQAVPPQSSLTLALALGVIAFFSGFGHRYVSGRILTVLSALGSAAALVVSKFGGSYEPLAIAALKAEMRPAYWGALACYLAGGLLNLVTFMPPRVAVLPEPPAGTKEPTVCPECGALWVSRQSVCRQCGKSYRIENS